eukprot:TRINITY_DN33761_c0_g1_i1.p1 TRINITY_DN33761_c0_g1~~TRINITY_DN33761_c0_g1_i1.p1  ORF type:complete len:792 (-),score=102.23 TRINITY_DN33761_c0_g1_i1:299-2647(-)
MASNRASRHSFRCSPTEEDDLRGPVHSLRWRRLCMKVLAQLASRSSWRGTSVGDRSPKKGRFRVTNQGDDMVRHLSSGNKSSVARMAVTKTRSQQSRVSTVSSAAAGEDESISAADSEAREAKLRVRVQELTHKVVFYRAKCTSLSDRCKQLQRSLKATNQVTSHMEMAELQSLRGKVSLLERSIHQMQKNPRAAIGEALAARSVAVEEGTENGRSVPSSALPLSPTQEETLEENVSTKQSSLPVDKAANRFGQRDDDAVTSSPQLSNRSVCDGYGTSTKSIGGDSRNSICRNLSLDSAVGSGVFLECSLSALEEEEGVSESPSIDHMVEKLKKRMTDLIQSQSCEIDAVLEQSSEKNRSCDSSPKSYSVARSAFNSSDAIVTSLGQASGRLLSGLQNSELVAEQLRAQLREREQTVINLQDRLQEAEEALAIERSVFTARYPHSAAPALAVVAAQPAPMPQFALLANQPKQDIRAASARLARPLPSRELIAPGSARASPMRSPDNAAVSLFGSRLQSGTFPSNVGFPRPFLPAPVAPLGATQKVNIAVGHFSAPHGSPTCHQPLSIFGPSRSVSMPRLITPEMLLRTSSPRPTKPTIGSPSSSPLSQRAATVALGPTLCRSVSASGGMPFSRTQKRLRGDDDPTFTRAISPTPRTAFRFPPSSPITNCRAASLAIPVSKMAVPTVPVDATTPSIATTSGLVTEKPLQSTSRSSPRISSRSVSMPCLHQTSGSHAPPPVAAGTAELYKDRMLVKLRDLTPESRDGQIVLRSQWRLVPVVSSH